MMDAQKEKRSVQMIIFLKIQKETLKNLGGSSFKGTSKIRINNGAPQCVLANLEKKLI
jgi:hypothetical protein